MLRQLSRAVPLGSVTGCAQHIIGISGHVHPTAVPLAFTVDAENTNFLLENIMCIGSSALLAGIVMCGIM